MRCSPSRISGCPLQSSAATASPPPGARELLEATGVSSPLTCGNRPPEGRSNAEHRNGLWNGLHDNNVPDWLEAMPRSVSPCTATDRSGPLFRGSGATALDLRAERAKLAEIGREIAGRIADGNPALAVRDAAIGFTVDAAIDHDNLVGRSNHQD